MIVIAGHVRIDPAQREEAVAAASEMMEATRRESGCISYAFSASLLEPGLFHVFEEWASQEALDAHFQAPHMATFQARAATLGLHEMAIQRYEVASVGPLS